ncbi:DUF2842 domain-containing protein [Kordiimonas marina]|uniref:DUF2842 domain-containing protein n=1 Tax=Kordiimonas marina TaxID=2872312 RepID=UPI001FF46275|nr:DUF2842 domain-containing protein [Kordiimonas marina]MCJ9427588.1 DUF2842 domain-containing protein [Kordiimonas marina]
MNDTRPSPRSFWGMLILLIGLGAYAFAAAAIGDLLVNAPIALQVIYYLIAGIVWIFPVKYLLKWMAAKRDK